MYKVFILNHNGCFTWCSPARWKRVFEPDGSGSWWIDFSNEKDSVYFRLCGFELTIIKAADV